MDPLAPYGRALDCARVSIIITCYNLGAYLEEALRSIPAGCEVIVIDDGSTDAETVQVLNGLDTQRYTVVRQANTGLATARNNGIRMAKGPYIVPLDADNRLRDAMVERSVAVLDARPDVDIVYGDAYYFGDEEKRWVVGDYDFKLLVERNRIDACACFRKGLWERLGGYDEHMPVMGYEDWDFWLRASAQGAAFHYVPEMLFDYRVRGGSMLGNTMRNRALLVDYIFGKKELRFLAPLRKAYLEGVERRRKERPITGRRLVAMLWQRIKARLTGSTVPGTHFIE